MTKVRELITGIGLTSSLNLPRLRVREMTFQRKREGDLDAREIIYIYIYIKKLVCQLACIGIIMS